MYHIGAKYHHCPRYDFTPKYDYEEAFARHRAEKERNQAIGNFLTLIGAAVVVFILLTIIFGWYGGGEKFVNCMGNVTHGTCSANKPYFCNNGTLAYDIKKCGCPDSQIIDGSACRKLRDCPDGTPHNNCSKNKPLFCYDGNLTSAASTCGCPNNYLWEGEYCRPEVPCSDGTKDADCSTRKPYWCENGTLYEKAAVCGCPGNTMLEGDECVDLEVEIHDGINAERVAHGLSRLVFDERLAAIARKHSEDMAKRNYFSHVNPDGLDPTGRASKDGYSCSKSYGTYYTVGVAENIFQGYTYGTIWYTNGIETRREWYTPKEIAQEAVTSWMGSPGHRQNILTSTYDREGIGVYVDSNGKVFVTENFC